ncbi:MAG: ATP-dependent Clp protease proteolytic subunit [Alistipes sp.]|nr:ATP-dependent Clp protease proteolytic subunit [Alistipes sp.]
MTNIFSIDINNSAGIATIDIEGTIGAPDYSDNGKVATYEEFKTKLAEINDLNMRKVVVNIRSTGGDVNDALLIYDALKEVNRKVETICYGYTASAATIIAQAASTGERKMSANGLYLIHQASTYADGNANELDAKADLLKKTDERIAAIYSAASGRPSEEFTALMAENNGKGKWLSAEEALAAGLIDTIINATTINNKFNPEEQGLPALPQNHIEMAEKQTVLDRMIAWFEKTEQTEVENKIAEKEAEVVNLTAERDAAVANVATLEAERDTLKAQLAEKETEVQNLSTQLAEAKAMAVKATEPVQQVQDPDPQGGNPKTANQLAYEADLAAFKH